MAAMKLNLILCFLLGFFSVSSAQQSEYDVRLIDKGTSKYPHAGRPEMYINGAWATICASDWDMNDAEVFCRDLDLGYANTLTVIGGLPAETDIGTECLSTVKCYGHEEHLSECGDVYPVTRSGSANDKGIVCYPPKSAAGLRLNYGPDEYSGWVEVLASGSWSKLYGSF